MMSVDEFIRKVVGIPWVDRACSFAAADCWGLVILYYRHVLNIDLNYIQAYQQKTCSLATHALIEAEKHWIQIDSPQDGCVFLAYIGDRPVHVGVVIDNNYVLHANGSAERSGQVQYHRLDAITRMYTKVEYYNYANLL